MLHVVFRHNLCLTVRYSLDIWIRQNLSVGGNDTDSDDERDEEMIIKIN